MRRWSWFVAALVAALSPRASWAEAERADGTLPFAPGEKLSYEVRLLGVHTADAELWVDEEPGDASLLRLHARGRTVGLTDGFTKLRQTAFCLVEADGLSPRLCRSTSRKRGGERRREVRVSEDGHVRERVVQDGEQRQAELRLPELGGPLQEALSGLFLLREKLPAAGETVRFSALRKGKPITVVATARGTSELSLPAGRFRAREVELRILEPQGKDDTSAGTLFVTDDERRLPVRMLLDAPVGKLDARLVEHTGAGRRFAVPGKAQDVAPRADAR